MTLRRNTLKLSSLALAVLGALVSMNAYAEEDDEAAALKRPTSTVEIGAIHVDDKSAKYGEYSGLANNRGYLDLNFALRGGSAYSNNEGGGLTRWSVSGNNLGLHSREAEAKIAVQGAWSVGVSYDALRHSISDTFQTPYQGSMGGNNFTLPAGFGTAANTQTLTAAQQAAYHTVDVHSTRENTAFTAGYTFSPALALAFDFNHLDQSGAKLLAVGSASKVGGAAAETVSILPLPTKYQTDTLNLALNWMGEKGHLSTAYYGSIFHNSDDHITYQTFAGANATQTFVTPPSNQLHQLSLEGNYALAAKTKLAGNLAISRNTQNETFTVDAGLLNAALPASSLNGLVVTKTGNLKLTNQSVKNLSLSAAYRYNDRDNRTPSNIYSFNATDSNNKALYPNTPLSTKKAQTELAADYRIDRSQSLRLDVSHEDTSRRCKQYAVSSTYPAGTNCVVATHSSENKVDTTYRVKASDTIDMRFGYAHSHRITDYDISAKAAFSGNNNGLGAGVNGGDFLGYYPYFDASRSQDAAKSSFNWQATDALSFSLGGRYTNDRYDQSTYGVQNGRSWSLNLDATYAYAEHGSVSVYASKDRKQRDLISLNNATTGAFWTNQLRDGDITIGLSAKQGGLMGDKLELSGDYVYAYGKTSYATQVPYLATCGAAATLSCGDVPDIKSRSVQLKLAARYTLDPHSAVRVQFIHARLAANDYYYNALQYGYTPTTVLPTNQQSGDYSVNAIGASYIYSF